MKRLLIFVWLFLFTASQLYAAGNETHTPLPNTVPDAAGYGRIRTFLQQEIPAVITSYNVGNRVLSGGLHSTVGGMTSPAFATEAITSSGNRVTANSAGGTAAINYTNVGCSGNDTAWVIISASSLNTLNNFTRSPGTNYFVNCVDSTEPTLPIDSAWLMSVTLSSSAITAVADYAIRLPAVLSACLFAGKDASIRMRSAIAALPSLGGVIDATCFIGAQSLTVDPFNGKTNVALLLGNAQFTLYTSLRPTTGSTIAGLGSGTRLIAAATLGDVPMIINATDPATLEDRDTDIHIRHMFMDGNKANNSGATEHSPCVFIRSVLDAWVESIHCVNPKGDGVQIGAGSTVAIYPERVTVRGISSIQPARNGIAVTEGLAIHIFDNTIVGAQIAGIDLEADAVSSIISEVHVHHNVISGGGGSSFSLGINISGTPGLASFVNVDHNIIENQVGSCVGFRDVDGLRIDGNTCRSVSTVCIFHVGGGTTVNSLDVVNNHLNTCGAQGITYTAVNAAAIDNNIIGVTGSNAIQLSGMSGGSISGNKITTVAGEAILLSNVIKSNISFNVIRGATGRGIRLLDTCTTNVLIGNAINDNGGSGISEENTSDFNIIEANSVFNNAVPTIQSNSGNSIIRYNGGWRTESSGNGTFASGEITSTFSHGLSKTPSRPNISITAAQNAINDVGVPYILSCNASTCTAAIRNEPGSGGMDFVWKAHIQ